MPISRPTLALEPDDPSQEKAGDTQRWVSLYRDHGECVYRLLHRMTGDADLAEDLLHDTFVLAITRHGQFGARGEISSWIFGIAVNLVRERGRTARRREELLWREGLAGERFAADEGRNITTRMVLEEAMLSLSDECRTTLLLHEVDGYSHAEIAVMMGIAEGSSRARLARAKADLRKKLQEMI